ncbi:hypothetical protein KRR40_11585 [Niabella defluvii]|nr:hypothetical protein KRR40_11585 [Niabella sp. I65]
MNIRNATIGDLQAINAIENICFPAAEAASAAAFEKRLRVFPRHFWLLEDKGQLVGFINGMTTNHTTINDAMFEHANFMTKTGPGNLFLDWRCCPNSARTGMQVS